MMCLFDLLLKGLSSGTKVGISATSTANKLPAKEKSTDVCRNKTTNLTTSPNSHDDRIACEHFLDISRGCTHTHTHTHTHRKTHQIARTSLVLA